MPWLPLAIGILQLLLQLLQNMTNLRAQTEAAADVLRRTAQASPDLAPKPPHLN